MATSTTIPSIACLGLIGRNNQPLHISIFPSWDAVNGRWSPVRSSLQFSLLLYSTIDTFEARGATNPSVSGDLGLLHAFDDRLAAYGYETNTCVRMVVVVDMRGREAASAGGAAARAAPAKLDLRGVFRAMQSAYVRLLQNPFYRPDQKGRIVSARFEGEMRKIGKAWTVDGMGL